VYGCRSAHFISYTGQCWDGGGSYAGDRHPTAADELRRFEHLVDLHDAGLGEQRKSSQVCELKFLKNLLCRMGGSS
jgi:hypothetical protein